MGGFRPATMADRPVLARSMASAFSDDPLFGWLVGVGTPLEPRMRTFFDAILKTYLRKADHLVFTDDEGAATACWRPVDGWKVPPSEILQGLPGMIGAFRHRIPIVLKTLAALEKAHPTEPHYYLEFLGTRADSQGHGLGSAALEPMLARCDAEGLPAYLESSNPRNIPFYARHGFEVRPTIDCGKGAPVCTPMWRAARGVLG